MHPWNSRHCVVCGAELSAGHKCRHQDTLRQGRARVKQDESDTEPERTYSDRLAEAEEIMRLSDGDS